MGRQLPLLSSTIFLTLWAVSGAGWANTNQQDSDILRFQLRSLDSGTVRCIAPKAVVVAEDEKETRLSVIPDSECGAEKKYFWEISTNHKIINVAYRGEDSGKGKNLCLTRSYSEGGALTVSLEACRSEDNDSQSWAFDKDGQLFEANYKGKSVRTASVPGGPDGVGAFAINGSFQWVRDYPPGSEFCYIVPWTDCRICGRYVEETDSCPAGNSNGSSGSGQDKESDKKPEGEQEPPNNGGGTPPPPPPNGPSPEDKPVPPPVAVIHKKAEWFILKQGRTDLAVCLDIAAEDGVTRVVQQLCSKSSESQQWGTDLATKAVYNKKLGSGVCLTRSGKSVVMSPCLDLSERDNNQWWYFSRGWTRGVPWAALMSYKESNLNWINGLQQNSYGQHAFMPKYTDCQLVEGSLCYDLPTGELRTAVPLYTN
ncbi:RICIN domain-containing protein [Sansalvadorimonas sp. 2012CJ34-2]|uniref:RICIN domain-containing protein n=1 Tax=Parendozoicomonas callyspongiae TaxID=2942213 RepID=A0ABT0PIL8_9GAMM|nr:RICIN domain-containing protein [Sansalvadorimonas sp. 2012CJ34-2]MCL6270328.1 RICIN domain-containing protein [Sansalvadorimonas sp. 2012CJ34-2]